MTLPPMYCLTLPDVPERKRAAQAHFDSRCLNVKFIDGYYARKMGLKSIVEYKDDMAVGGKPWIIGQGSVGNILSHTFILRAELNFIHSEEFIIFEDDARVPNDFVQQYIKARLQLPPDWDVLYMEHCCTEGKPTTMVAPNIAFVQYPFCTAGLLIRKRAVPALLEAVRDMWAPIDIAYAKRAYATGAAKPYCVWPKLVRQLTYDNEMKTLMFNRREYTQ